MIALTHQFLRIGNGCEVFEVFVRLICRPYPREELKKNCYVFIARVAMCMSKFELRTLSYIPVLMGDHVLRPSFVPSA